MVRSLPPLARAHLALGAADTGLPAPRPSPVRRALAAIVLAVLGAANLAWCAGPAVAAAAGQPATLPDAPGLVADADAPA